MIYRIKKLCLVLIISLLIFSFPAVSLSYTYNWYFEYTPPATLDWACPLPLDDNNHWPTVTSSWNTPRDVGTNPHRGVDLSAKYGTTVYAVWDGWLTQVGLYTIRFQIDINSDRIKNDTVYYCEHYHLSNREDPDYYTKGQPIGNSGNEGGQYDPHLHFGGASSNIRWYRNEVNYRYQSEWNNGKDVDSFKWVEWNNNNTAAITIYFMDSPTSPPPISPSEVVIFHRKNGTSTWTNGGSMAYIGNYKYTYSFAGKYPTGTTINWLVRIKRSGLGDFYPYCWAPAKYDNPDPNPNSTSYPYAYITNTIN